MISRISELFEVDVEDLIETLQELSTTAEYLEINIKEENYLKYVKSKITLLQELKNIEKIAYNLVVTYTLIQRKLDRYRPNDQLTYSYLLKINRYIDYLNKLAKEISMEAQKNSIYNLDTSLLYENLEEIKIKTLEAKEIVERAIQEGAFI
jgi:hypothetical protein